MSTARTTAIHFGNGVLVEQDTPELHIPAPPEPHEQRPDIVLLFTLRGASDQIRKELSVIGDESQYREALIVLRTKGRQIAELADELLTRTKGSVA
jgi:hypothetical protein